MISLKEITLLQYAIPYCEGFTYLTKNYKL